MKPLRETSDGFDVTAVIARVRFGPDGPPPFETAMGIIARDAEKQGGTREYAFPGVKVTVEIADDPADDF